MPISTAIKLAAAQGTGIYATLVKVTSVHGDSVAYALGTRDVTFDGDTYIAAPFEPSQVQRESGVSVDNATISHILSEYFTKLDIKGGKWDGARVFLFAVDLM